MDNAVATGKASVLIILLDALRADCTPGADGSPHLRSLGLMPPDLPALRDLVEGSFTFTQAMACAPYTTACAGSIFTGLLPPEHGVRAFDLTSLSSQVRTLAEILSAAGYVTCAMTDQPPVLQPMGLLRGFQTTVAGEDEALAWWDSFAGAPRLLFLHLWDAHKPYGMPFGRAYRSAYPAIVREWQERLRAGGIAEPATSEFLDEHEERQRVYRMQFAWEGALGFKAGLESYMAGLQTFDRGRLRDLATALQARRALDESVSVVLADHGEGRDWPPSQRMTHDISLADDIMHIPLYVRAPAWTNPRPIADQVSQADVTPTILDLLGLLGERTAPRSDYNGRSLVPLLRGEQLPRRPAYAEVLKLNNDPTKPVAQSGGQRQATLHARVLRYPERKHRLAGQPTILGAILEQEPEDIVKLICRHLLGRIETADDAAAWLPIYRDASLPRRDKWAALMRAIADSDEYRLLNKYAVYDLRSDPLEVKPIAPQQAGWDDYRAQVAIMQAIDQCARPGEPLLTNEADEQVILKRLQALGYVE